MSRLPVHFDLGGLVLLLLVLACASAPEPADFESCPDVDCRRAWVLENWAERSDEVVDKLTSLPDPLERIALATILTESFPGQVGALCDRLPEGPGRTYCKKANGRPHLHQEPANPDTLEGIWVRGPFALGAQPPVPEATFGDVSAVELECVSGMPRSVCYLERAKKEAREGQVPIAAGICNSLESDQWRYECFFQASEAAAPKGNPHMVNPEGVVGAVDLCLAAGTYRSNCFQHLLTALSRVGPAADDTSEGAWDRLVAVARSATDAISAHDPELSVLFEDRLWASATWMAYHQAESLTGDALDALPETAWPHVRAAVTWEMLDRAPGEDAEVGLAAWSERAARDLSGRASAASTAPSEKATSIRQKEPGSINPGWTKNRGSEASLDWVHHLQRSRRVKGTDAEQDLLIALLEAAATQDTPRTSLLVEGLEHPHEWVRWSALRLLIELDAPDLQDHADGLSDDPSELVRDLLSFDWVRMRRNSRRRAPEPGGESPGASSSSLESDPSVSGKNPVSEKQAKPGKRPTNGKKPNPGKRRPPGDGPGSKKKGGQPNTR